MVLPVWIHNPIAYSLQTGIFASARTQLADLFRLRRPHFDTASGKPIKGCRKRGSDIAAKRGAKYQIWRCTRSLSGEIVLYGHDDEHGAVAVK
jgi:hypothetical protein